MIYSFPHSNGAVVEIYKKISNLIWYVIVHVITYPCLD